MKLKDLFEVLPCGEYVKIYSREEDLKYKGTASQYKGNREEVIFTLFSNTAYDGVTYIEIILD